MIESGQSFFSGNVIDELNVEERLTKNSEDAFQYSNII